MMSNEWSDAEVANEATRSRRRKTEVSFTAIFDRRPRLTGKTERVRRRELETMHERPNSMHKSVNHPEWHADRRRREKVYAWFDARFRGFRHGGKEKDSRPDTRTKTLNSVPFMANVGTIP